MRMTYLGLFGAAIIAIACGADNYPPAGNTDAGELPPLKKIEVRDPVPTVISDRSVTFNISTDLIPLYIEGICQDENGTWHPNPIRVQAQGYPWVDITVEGLLPTTPYKFTAKAYDKQGRLAGQSNTVTFTSAKTPEPGWTDAKADLGGHMVRRIIDRAESPLELSDEDTSCPDGRTIKGFEGIGYSCFHSSTYLFDRNGSWAGEINACDCGSTSWLTTEAKTRCEAFNQAFDAEYGPCGARVTHRARVTDSDQSSWAYEIYLP